MPSYSEMAEMLSKYETARHNGQNNQAAAYRHEFLKMVRAHQTGANPTK